MGYRPKGGRPLAHAAASANPAAEVARPDGRVELADPHIYIVVWLGFYGGLPGAVAGVLVAGYWIINRTRPGA
jgi:hypothetical protein